MSATDDMHEVDDIMEATKHENEVNHTEAPLSINIGSYYRGFYVGWTKRSSDNKVSDKIDDIKKFVDGLVTAGYEPSWNKETSAKALNINPTPIQAPIVADLVPTNATCPVHGSNLEWKTGISKTTNKPYAFWACNTKNADGSYCKAGGKK